MLLYIFILFFISGKIQSTYCPPTTDTLSGVQLDCAPHSIGTDLVVEGVVTLESSARLFHFKTPESALDYPMVGVASATELTFPPNVRVTGEVLAGTVNVMSAGSMTVDSLRFGNLDVTEGGLKLKDPIAVDTQVAPFFFTSSTNVGVFTEMKTSRLLTNDAYAVTFTCPFENIGGSTTTHKGRVGRVDVVAWCTSTPTPSAFTLPSINIYTRSDQSPSLTLDTNMASWATVPTTNGMQASWTFTGSSSPITMSSDLGNLIVSHKWDYSQNGAICSNLSVHVHIDCLTTKL